MKCFYHNDMDGRCAASIVAQYENNFNHSDYFELDYSNPNFKNKIKSNVEFNEKVYFVDLSFTEETVDILYILLGKKADITWIDHHTSSIKLVQENSKLKDAVNGVVSEGLSGAALTYMYLYNCDDDNIPMYIKLVSDYDCWKFKHDPQTTYFKIGVESRDYNALDNVWDLLFNEKGIPRIQGDIIEHGKIIKDYIDKDNMSYRDSYSYECKIANFNALVVNRKTNSWIFGEKIKDYDLVCVWVYNGDKYSYSIYSDKGYVDCSWIAEKFGGGGHKGAAGFSSKDLLFKKS